VKLQGHKKNVRHRVVLCVPQEVKFWWNRSTLFYRTVLTTNHISRMHFAYVKPFVMLADMTTDPEGRNRLRKDSAFFFWLDPEPKICEILDADPASLFIFDSSRYLCGLYKCYCLCTNIAEFRLHRWLPESEQEPDSQFWKTFWTRIRTKIKKFWSRSGVGA